MRDTKLPELSHTLVVGVVVVASAFLLPIFRWIRLQESKQDNTQVNVTYRCYACSPAKGTTHAEQRTTK